MPSGHQSYQRVLEPKLLLRQQRASGGWGLGPAQGCGSQLGQPASGFPRLLTGRTLSMAPWREWLSSRDEGALGREPTVSSS